MTPQEQRLELRRRQLAARVHAAKAAQSTGVLEQGMSGVNEGIGSMLGAPVDLATTAVNAMVPPSIDAELVTGQDGIPRPKVRSLDQPRAINNPVGGSQWFNEGILNPTISDAPPQNLAQRVARRVGQEAGQTVLPTLGLLGKANRGVSALDDLAGAAQANPGAYLAAEAAGTIGSGLGGATAQEVAPNSAIAQLIGQALGGGLAAGGLYAANRRPKAPSIDDLKARQAAAYDVVDKSPAQLTPQSTQALQGNVSSRAASDAMDPFLAPKATRVAERIGTLDQPTISEVEKMRRLVGRDVAGAVDPTERAIGMGMKDEITDYLDNLKPQDVVGGDPTEAIDALQEGRDMTRRIKKSNDITNRVYKAENRAATSGTGGNEVNAVRQNIRQILDDPRKRSAYTPDEVAAMEQIVKGTPVQNAMRLIGRLSPTSGALPAMAGGGLVAGGIGASNPWLAIPPMAGMAAKGAAEMLTKQGVSKLDELIRNAGPLPKKSLTGAQKSALAILFASQILNGGGAQ